MCVCIFYPVFCSVCVCVGEPMPGIASPATLRTTISPGVGSTCCKLYLCQMH